MGRTQGTETSQYLEEKKANAIPSVAASERGTAQTAEVFLCGVVGPSIWELPSGLLAESVWKVEPQRVTVP